MENHLARRQGSLQFPEASYRSHADFCQHHRDNGAVTLPDEPGNTLVRNNSNCSRGNSSPEVASGISFNHQLQENSPAYCGERLQQYRPQENEVRHQNPNGTSSTFQHPHIPGPSNSVLVTSGSARNLQTPNLNTSNNSMQTVLVYPSNRNWEDEKRYSQYEVHNCDHVETMKNWDSLHSQIQNNINGFHILPNVPFQSKMIPQILAGNDVMGQARTRVGKSCAAGITIIQKILTTDPAERHAAKNERSPLALILTPSATIVNELFKHHKYKLARGTDVTVCKAYGGIPKYELEQNLNEGCEVLIGCNGRVLDLLKHGRINLYHLQFIVFEFANCLVGQFLRDSNCNLSGILRYLGFAAQRIYLDEEFLPEVENQIESWSSSFYSRKGIVKVITKLPQRRTNVNLMFHKVHYGNKTMVLRELLKKEESGKQKRTVIFVEEESTCKTLADELSEDGNLVLPVCYGQLDETKKVIYEMFKIGNINTVVLTSTPLREYDTVDIDQIIQYDIPSEYHTFVHRCGEFGNMEVGSVHAFVETSRPTIYRGEKQTFKEYLEERKKLELVPEWLKSLTAGNCKSWKLSHDEECPQEEW